MYLPISWLRELVDIDGIPMKKIEDSLFSCGLEVEEKLPVAPDIKGVYSGIVTKIERHPDSDHMFVCMVDCGEQGRDIQIVTGAQNVNAGDIVPVALEGATVYSRKKGNDSAERTVMTIKRGKLRGIESNGMLCSGEELGIDDDWYNGASVDGIMKLPSDTKPGCDVKALLGLDDEVWDISVTANLPHCQCVFGVARELAALLDRPLRVPDMSYKAEKLSGEGEKINISVSAPDLCPRYIGHYVGDVKIVRSPEWMRRRLKMCGHSVINSIVDITNYILVEMGQPMHAFDMVKLSGRKIDVRRAKMDEKIVTLDEKEFTLGPENLVICDGEGPVAIAGIMGGLHSGISDGTTEILFEAAKFERGSIRRTSRALGQASDSSRRFEKGVDAYTTRLAMNRALHLIEELGCGRVGVTDIDVYDESHGKNRPITTTFRAINDILGIEVPADTITAILRRLNYTVETDGVSLTATAPGYREDIEGNTADLAEDVIKVYGYEHIKPRFLTNCAITAGGYSPEQEMARSFKRTMCSIGFSETMSYSFFSPADLDLLDYPGDAPERSAVLIANPLSEKYSIMRTTLVPSIVSVLSRNAKRARESVRVFELARVFIPREGERPAEYERAVFGMYDAGGGESFFTAKGVFETIADTMRLNFTYERVKKPFLHPGVSARVLCGNEEIGYFGQLTYEAAEKAEIPYTVFVGDIDYAKLAELSDRRIVFRSVTPFREVKRDIALIAPEVMTSGEIEAVIRSSCPSVGNVRLFDIYRGVQVGEGYKSMAYSITFVPDSKELMPEDVDKFISKILRALEYRLGLKIRS